MSLQYFAFLFSVWSIRCFDAQTENRLLEIQHMSVNTFSILTWQSGLHVRTEQDPLG